MWSLLTTYVHYKRRRAFILENLIQSHFLELGTVTSSWLSDPSQTDVFQGLAEELKLSLIGKNKVITFGNGGSAAEASHFAGEIVGKCVQDNGAWPALCLNESNALLTCISNDWSFDYVFTRQLEAFANPADLVIAFSTSGQSTNVLNAIKYCKEKGIKTSLWTSAKCPDVNLISDFNIIAPTNGVIYAQELHLALIHILSIFLESSISR